MLLIQSRKLTTVFESLERKKFSVKKTTKHGTTNVMLCNKCMMVCNMSVFI